MAVEGRSLPDLLGERTYDLLQETNEQEEKGVEEVEEQAGRAQESTPQARPTAVRVYGLCPACHSRPGLGALAVGGGDSRDPYWQLKEDPCRTCLENAHIDLLHVTTFFTGKEGYYDALDEEANIHHGDLDQDERYQSSKEEDGDADTCSEAPGGKNVDREEDGVDHEGEGDGTEACREEAEANALSNLADSLPDDSLEDKGPAMGRDPRHLISQSLMKALLDPRPAENEATVEEETEILEGNDSSGNDSLDVTPFGVPAAL